jgi:hypothetical protein
MPYVIVSEAKLSSGWIFVATFLAPTVKHG